MSRWAVACGLLALPSVAGAFCGTYVGQAGSEVFNKASKVTYAHYRGRTTLTLANDFHGDTDAFALVIPVPEILTADEVRTIRPELMDRLDEYSAPRLVHYEPEQLRDPISLSCGCTSYDLASASPNDADTDLGVTVEAEFAAGEYDIVVLSAVESDGLLTWLDNEGYGVDPSASTLLQEYIEAGTFFFAARIDASRLPSGQQMLSPLQFTYPTNVLSLPIRLGTLNSAGSQDLILYTLSDSTTGQIGISNYPQVTVEDDCMWDAEEGDDFGEWYDAKFQQAMDDQSEPAWNVEYSWAPSGCDPCSGDPLSYGEIASFFFAEGSGDSGFDTGFGGLEGIPSYWDAHFTRIHMRYAPGAVDEDLVLYGTNETPNEQVRYIEGDPRLRRWFDWCDDPPDPAADDNGVSDTADGGAGCNVPMRTVPWLAVLLVGVVTRRRRSPRMR